MKTIDEMIKGISNALQYLFLCCCLLMVQLSASAHKISDSMILSHQDLAMATEKQFAFSLNTKMALDSYMPLGQVEIKSAKMGFRFSFGETFEYGSTPETSTVDLRVTLNKSQIGTVNVFTETHDFSMALSSPDTIEKMFLVDSPTTTNECIEMIL